jgi:hypothetical protein
MELKKYVMNTITKRIYVFEKQNGNIMDFYRGNHESDKSSIIHADDFKYFHKTSDNILDLVEVGDLVEMDNEWEILQVLRLSKTDNPICIVRTSSNTEEYELNNYRKGFIVAIYKRQLNGDYKKYEDL